MGPWAHPGFGKLSVEALIALGIFTQSLWLSAWGQEMFESTLHQHDDTHASGHDGAHGDADDCCILLHPFLAHDHVALQVQYVPN